MNRKLYKNLLKPECDTESNIQAFMTNFEYDPILIKTHNTIKPILETLRYYIPDDIFISLYATSKQYNIRIGFISDLKKDGNN